MLRRIASAAAETAWFVQRLLLFIVLFAILGAVLIADRIWPRPRETRTVFFSEQAQRKHELQVAETTPVSTWPPTEPTDSTESRPSMTPFVWICLVVAALLTVLALFLPSSALN